MKHDAGADGRLREALRLLADEARARLEAHPWGHLLEGRREGLRLTLELPLEARNGSFEKVVAAASEALAAGVHEVLSHRAIFRPGRVYCLRCASAECDHARPASAREVFTGYAANGLPRFRDFGQWLLEVHDPRVDQLYEESPGLVTRTSPGSELDAEVLPGYRDRENRYRIHGQVAVGWYTVPDASGDPWPLAVAFQLVSTGAAAGPRRYGVNVLATGPGAEEVQELQARMGELPWNESLQWARDALDSVEQAARGPRGPGAKAVERRLEGILSGFARRLEKGRRGLDRRTRHAELRRSEGDRPTDMAMADFRRARGDEQLFDERRQTFVVLGERGRVHVFSPEGKHVTSVRYSPAAIGRRREKGLWRPTNAEERALLAKQLGSLSMENETMAAAMSVLRPGGPRRRPGGGAQAG